MKKSWSGSGVPGSIPREASSRLEMLGGLNADFGGKCGEGDCDSRWLGLRLPRPPRPRPLLKWRT